MGRTDVEGLVLDRLCHIYLCTRIIATQRFQILVLPRQMEELLPHGVLRADSSSCLDKKPFLLFLVQKAFSRGRRPSLE